MPMCAAAGAVEPVVKLKKDGIKVKERSRCWTDMEVNIFAIILTDETYNFALQLENLAAKKSSNYELLLQVECVFNQALMKARLNELNTEGIHDCVEPLDTSPEKLRKKYSNLKADWRKQTARGTVNLPKEPRWFSLLGPIFRTDFINVDSSCTKIHCKQSPERHSDAATEETEYCSIGTAVKNESEKDSREYEDSPIISSTCSPGMFATKLSSRKSSIATQEVSRTGSTPSNPLHIGKTKTASSQNQSSVKLHKGTAKSIFSCSPHRKRRLLASSSDINNLACGVRDLANSLIQLKQLSVESEQRRDEMFLRFLSEEGEKNRAHHLQLTEMFIQGGATVPGLKRHQGQEDAI